LEPFWTSALVRSEAVSAASVLAPPVLGTFVVVHTEGAGIVQLIATWADAPEAAVGILARARRWTQALHIIQYRLSQTKNIALILDIPEHSIPSKCERKYRDRISKG
jgi:hypothetical protein